MFGTEFYLLPEARNYNEVIKCGVSIRMFIIAKKVYRWQRGVIRERV